MSELPHLATTHPQYPDGFPARVNDDLLGHWKTPDGIVIVEDHPHGYEIHFYPCYDFENCDACSPDRGPRNPFTDDGHHFRECPQHGVILNVAGGETGYNAVLEYLSRSGSPPHMREFAELLSAREQEEHKMRESERLEAEKAEAERVKIAPSREERLAALEAEIAALRQADS